MLSLKGKFTSLTKRFYLLSVAAFLYHLTNSVIRPIFTLYMLDLGASMLQVGVILSLQSSLMIFLRLPLTFIAQKIGERKMIYIIFLVQATTQILYSLIYDPIWLYFIPFYQILAAGSFFQLATSMASNMAPQNKQGDTLGRFMTFMSMGMFIGPIICSYLVKYVTYHQIFMFSAVFPIIGSILLFQYKFPERQPLFFFFPILKTLKNLLKQRNIFILSFIRTTYSISNSMFITLFAIYAVFQLNLSPSLAAFLFSILGLANAFVKIPAGKISDIVGRKKVLIIVFSIIVLNYIAIAYATHIVLFGILIILFGLCWGTRAVTEWSFLTRSLSQETKTIGISYMETFWDIGAALGSILAGILADMFPFSTIFVIAALINIPAIFSIYAMKTQN